MGELRGAASSMSSPAGSMAHLQIQGNLVLIGNIDESEQFTEYSQLSNRNNQGTRLYLKQLDTMLLGDTETMHHCAFKTLCLCNTVPL